MINRLHACKASQYSEPVSENGCLKHLPKSLVMTFCHRLPCSDQLIIDIKIPSTAIRQGFCTLTIYVSHVFPCCSMKRQVSVPPKPWPVYYTDVYLHLYNDILTSHILAACVITRVRAQCISSCISCSDNLLVARLQHAHTASVAQHQPNCSSSTRSLQAALAESQRLCLLTTRYTYFDVAM